MSSTICAMEQELRINGERARRVVANITAFLSSEPTTQEEMDTQADALWGLQDDLAAILDENEAV